MVLSHLLTGMILQVVVWRVGIPSYSLKRQVEDLFADRAIGVSWQKMQISCSARSLQFLL